MEAFRSSIARLEWTSCTRPVSDIDHIQLGNRIHKLIPAVVMVAAGAQMYRLSTQSGTGDIHGAEGNSIKSVLHGEREGGWVGG